MPIGAAKLGVLGAGLVPGGTETFNAPGTFSIPPGVKKVSVTGKGGTGNPGNAGNAGNAGTLGFGGTGGGGGGGKTPINENPCGPARVLAAGSGGRVFTGTGGVLTNSSIQGGAGGYSGTAIPPYTVPSAGASGVTGTAGQAGQAGQAGNPGNAGQSSSGLGNTLPGGAGGNAGAAGNAGAGGSGGPAGGGGQGVNAPTFSNPTSGGSGGTGAGNGGAGGSVPAAFGVGAGGGGGAGATNDGFSGENPCNRTILNPGACPSLLNNVGRGGTGGQTSGFSESFCCIATGASFAPVSNNMNNTTSPFSNLNPQNFGPLLSVTGGSGGRQFPSPNAARPGDDAIGSFQGNIGLRNPPSPRTPNTSMFQANVNNPIIRSGRGGGAGARTGCSPPTRRSGAGGGGGGRGAVGNPGGPGGAGGTGGTANPTTFNCVPVTPGGTAPITVASPGGQVVISWNPQ